MVELKFFGKDGYYIKYTYDGLKCVQSEDSDGKISYHKFDDSGTLTRTDYKSGFWKEWKDGYYTDSDGVRFEIEAPANIGYHGTDIINAKRILQGGYSNTSDMHWQQSTGRPYVMCNRSGLYSDEHCINMALKFANVVASKTGNPVAVVKFDLKHSVVKKVSVDRYDPSYEIITEIKPIGIIEMV